MLHYAHVLLEGLLIRLDLLKMVSMDRASQVHMTLDLNFLDNSFRFVKLSKFLRNLL